jgi:hypothetical protein
VMDAAVEAGFPADCPTEVTDAAKRLLVINCDPACGGSLDNCRTGPFARMICRPAGLPIQNDLAEIPILGPRDAEPKYNRIRIRMPASPWVAFHECDPSVGSPGEVQHLVMTPQPVFALQTYVWQSLTNNVPIRVAAGGYTKRYVDGTVCNQECTQQVDPIANLASQQRTPANCAPMAPATGPRRGLLLQFLLLDRKHIPATTIEIDYDTKNPCGGAP